jgi:decaprenylphospho-beta-D-ribofuranose 2-oxidase
MPASIPATHSTAATSRGANRSAVRRPGDCESDGLIRQTTDLAGWGNYPRYPTALFAPWTPSDVPALTAQRWGLIARGNGRAYGDAAIGAQFTISTSRLARMRAFDPETGLLTVEAGVLIADILATFAPRGFFMKVVPGTKFVSIGGAIAADVHGKNHHRDGGFGDNLESFELALPTGEIVTCSRSLNIELFAATVGGMGLTGVIVAATIRLFRIETAWMRQETRVAVDLDAAITALEDSASATYSVAWIDCLARGASLGRSLIYSAEHATRRDKDALQPRLDAFCGARQGRISVPAAFPAWVLNRASVKAFNTLYFRNGSAQAGAPSLVHWDPYFFPLDSLTDWNRIYGRKGFVQYQCVIPLHRSRAVLAEILDRVSRRGSASFLAVLKMLGESSGLMSFPLRGYTLAMDFPVSRTLFAFLDELDKSVAGASGRLYLAKDARQSRKMLESGYPGLPAFRGLRRQAGAQERFVSQLSARLGL